MNIIKSKIFGLHSQRGAALIIAVLILMILTVIGIYAVTTSTLETKISGSERELKVSFYAADAGEPIGINIIKAIIQFVPTSAGALPDPWKSVVEEDDLVTTEIFSDVRDITDNPTNNTDVVVERSDLGLPSSLPIRINMDIDRLGSHQIAGGATEYGAGYEGIGKGGGGDVEVIYVVDSLGRYTFSNTASEIEAGYRYVVAVPGGE